MMQPILLQKFLESQTGLGIVIFAGTFIQFFTFATPFLIHFVTKKYVRALYYDESKDIYTALMYNFWSADKMVSFKIIVLIKYANIAFDSFNKWPLIQIILEQFSFE